MYNTVWGAVIIHVDFCYIVVVVVVVSLWNRGHTSLAS